jgi:hypothetical protein
MLRTITFLLLGTTVAQAGGPLDDIRGPVDQSIKCMVAHGNGAPQCQELVKAVGRLCGTKPDWAGCTTAFMAEIKKHFPVPKQKSVLAPEAAAILSTVMQDHDREWREREARSDYESQMRRQREADSWERGQERANDEYRMWEMNDRLERLERRQSDR